MRLKLTLSLSSLVFAGCAQTAPVDTPHSSESSSAATKNAPSSAPHSPASLSALPPPPPRANDTDRKSKNGKLEATINGVPVLVQYGRPNVNERAIFGNLVPYGKVWRTGADEATTITFGKPALVAGEKIEAGTYALFTVPGDKSWQLILNQQAKQWGAYRHDASKDVLKAEVKVKSQTSTETLTFSESDSAIHLAWADKLVTIPISSR